MMTSRFIIVMILGLAVYSCSKKAVKTNDEREIYDYEEHRDSTVTENDIISEDSGSDITDIIVLDDSFDEKVFETADGKVIIIRNLNSDWQKEHRNIWKDTVLCDYYIKWGWFDSYDICDLIGPEDTNYRFIANNYTTNIEDADTLIYTYGALAKFIIAPANQPEVAGDTIVINNQRLRDCLYESDLKKRLNTNILVENRDSYNQFDLHWIDTPINDNDTIKFVLSVIIPDTDCGRCYYYSWAAQGDSLYETDDFDDYYETDDY